MSTRLAGTGTRLAVSLGAAFLAAMAAAEELPSKPLLKAGVRPKNFGTQEYSVTVVSALSFLPARDPQVYQYLLSPSLGRYCGNCTAIGQAWSYWAALDLPEGAVIDHIGFNTTTDTDAVLGVSLWQRNYGSDMHFLTGFSVPAHGWATDWAGPLNISIPSNEGREFVLQVEQAGHPNPQFFAWVEVWWRRSVSYPPSSATFNDVSTDHLFFQFVEALYASGITAGCGGGNYCPDNPVTRGQMAAFLAKALGLHWRNCCPN
jgi:hypothetical protein